MGGPVNKLSIDEIHEIELNILKKIHEIATGEKLTYFVAYGTLIGAVRHQGFIPWDDDLDIMMPRSDYDRMVDYFESHEKELYPYKIFTPQNNPDYPHMIARVCNLEYPIVVDNEIPCGMGVFVDVYPMDGIGTDRDAWERRLKKKQRMVVACQFSMRKKFVPPRKFYRVPDRYLLYCYAKWRGRDYLMGRLERYAHCFTWEESSYVSCAVWEVDIYEKRWLNEVVWLPFCDMQVPAPKEYDKVLKVSFPDYMQLPPEEERVPQHEYHAYRRE